jgi:hypothetical protein
MGRIMKGINGRKIDEIFMSRRELTHVMIITEVDIETRRAEFNGLLPLDRRRKIQSNSKNTTNYAGYDVCI